MSGLNKVMLIGNLGKDPEIRHLEGNISVAKFPLATSEVYKNKEGQRVEQTEWHNVVLWRGLADSAEKILKKGSLVFIEGRIKTRSWDDQAGNKKYITEIVAETMTLLARKNEENGAHGERPATQSESTAPAPMSETPSDITGDLPF
jgi:single-strand DNA-binding protein